MVQRRDTMKVRNEKVGMEEEGVESGRERERDTDTSCFPLPALTAS